MDDPIIKSMQDNRSEPPKGEAGPAPKPPIGMAGEPKKGLGDPPAAERAKISYKPPEPPKPVKDERDIPPPPKDKTGMPELPKPMKSLHEGHVKLPHSVDGTPKVNLVFIIVTVILIVLGTFVLYNKIGGFETDSAQNVAAVKQNVDNMNAKLDLTIQKIQEQETLSAKLEQELFDAGADIQKAADELSAEGDKLIADGEALKSEGQANQDQAKIDRGQNQIDRGTAMKEHAENYGEQAMSYRETSGMDMEEK